MTYRITYKYGYWGLSRYFRGVIEHPLFGVLAVIDRPTAKAMYKATQSTLRRIHRH